MSFVRNRGSPAAFSHDPNLRQASEPEDCVCGSTREMDPGLGVVIQKKYASFSAWSIIAVKASLCNVLPFVLSVLGVLAISGIFKKETVTCE